MLYSEKIKIIESLIIKGEELTAQVFCFDEQIPISLFKKILIELNPESKLIK